MAPLSDFVKMKLEFARKYRKTGNFAAAEQELDEALRAHPGHTVVREAMGQLYLAAGRVEDAAHLADQLLQDHPGSAGPIRLMGEVLLRQGRPLEALEQFLEAERQVPSSYVSSLVARALIRAKDFAEAARRAEDSLRRYPDDPYLLSHLEVAYSGLGQVEKATAICERLLAQKPQDPYAVRDLVKNRLASLPAAEVPAELEGILRVPSYERNPQVQKLAAEHWFKAGDHERAARAYQRALELAPGDRWAREQLGFCHYRQGRFREALGLLEPFFLDDPRNVFVRNAVIGSYQKLGLAVELEQLFDRALASHPDVKQLYGIRKKALRMMGGSS